MSKSDLYNAARRRTKSRGGRKGFCSTSLQSKHVCMVRYVYIYISGHLLFSDIRDQRYRTELDIGTSYIGLKRAESDIISVYRISE